MISEFLIKCSGADTDILQACPKSERTKFVGIGATIFLTSILAGVSGAYAIFFTFENLFISLLFGVLWTLIIFNLDRYIVSSIRKQGNFKKEFYVSIPRIIISVLLAITISKPLELKLFDGSISKKLSEIESNYNKSCEDDFNAKLLYLTTEKGKLVTQSKSAKNGFLDLDPIVKAVKDQIGVVGLKANSLQTLINNNKYIINQNITYQEVPLPDGKTQRIKKYNKEALKRISDNNGFSTQIKGYNTEVGFLNDSIGKRTEVLLNQIKTSEKQYSSQIGSLQHRIDELNNNRASIIEKCKLDAAKEKDILARLKALSKLKNEDRTAYLAGLLITILFVLIETSPIIVKLMSKVGAYDKMFDRIEEEFFLKQEVLLDNRKDEINNKISEFKELNRIQAKLKSDSEMVRANSEVQALEQIHNEILKKQYVVSKHRVNDWFKAELDALNIKVNAYLPKEKQRIRGGPTLKKSKKPTKRKKKK